jgi:hypothetical protein
MKNASYNSYDVIKQCETKLNIKFRTKKECNGWYIYDDKKVTRITVPQGRKVLPPKTYKAMAFQLKLSVDEFDDFLDCPLDKDKYDRLLIDRQVIKVDN